MRLGGAVMTEHFFFSSPGRSAARVLWAGVHSTLHGVVFAIFCPGPAVHRRRTVCRVRDTRSLVPRACGTNRSSSNTSCSRCLFDAFSTCEPPPTPDHVRGRLRSKTLFQPEPQRRNAQKRKE